MALATTVRAERPLGLGRGTRDELIVQNMGLVEGLARRYVAAGEPMDDVVQAGMIGLIKAADRFDPARGDFRSFAAPTILGEIRRHFRDHSWAVNVTRGVKDDAVAVSRAIEHLSARLGRSPSVADLADEAGISADRVLDALGASSAYRPDTLSRTPWLEDDDGETDIAETEKGYELAEGRAVLDDALQALPARERIVLHLRFEEDLIQSQIAARLGISQMHVSRLIARALETLQESVTAERPPGAGAAWAPPRPPASR